MNMKIPIIAVTVAVAIIITATVLMPVLQDSEKSMNGIEYNGGSDYTVRMNYGTPEEDLWFNKPAGEMYVECRYGSMDAEPYYIVPLNTVGQMGWILCTSSFSLGITGYAPQPLDTTSKYNGQGAGGYNTVENHKTVKLNATTGSITIWSDYPNGSWSSYDNCDLDHVFWADPNGDYINVQVPGKYLPDYIEDTKAIAGSSMTKGNYIFYYDTDHIVTTASKSATVTTETTEMTNGLYKLTKVPMTITGTDDSVNEVTSAHVIVKYKAVGEPVAGYDGYSALFNAIPFIVITAILLGVVALVIRSKSE